MSEIRTKKECVILPILSILDNSILNLHILCALKVGHNFHGCEASTQLHQLLDNDSKQTVQELAVLFEKYHQASLLNNSEPEHTKELFEQAQNVIFEKFHQVLLTTNCPKKKSKKTKQSKTN
ncbi:hypothetical protein RFI_14096 [Reticulomyxa filosa]|uniref:Uncharacterized protein n=1 Tax=Reticulomyxa filosa TaxID=46433 RepID=X6NBE3_RETFI|nr:hypothetical protein RFI_14096 [Reticulomyxa filosa]|eukprot:ETO23089.1 hypothetical protein RFI_14096 [Reticulomyxa filosa]